MGKLAAQLLLERLQSPDATPQQEVAIKPRLIVRETTAPPRQASNNARTRRQSVPR
jgi:DNA-binding LacI/PurR family transcriptional regulator